MAGTEGTGSAQKTFIVEGGGTSVVRAVLEKWGWTESPEKKQFDLRWNSLARKVDGLLLPPGQIVNHFRGSEYFGSKHGLGQCLVQCPACSAEFFPRQYDLRRAQQLKEFLEDFTASEARAQCSKSTDCPMAARVLERNAAGEKLFRCPHESAELLGRVPFIPSQMESRLRPFLDEYARSLETATCSNCCDTALSPKAELSSTDMSVASRQEALAGSENVWILKPPFSSKGQGIAVRCGLKRILTEAEKRTKKNQRWYCVVQKYMERPLLLPNHIDAALSKVDLRLWTVVISWNPLICFAHPEVYARIATRPFVVDPDAKFETEAHVTNIRDEREDNRVDTKTFMSMLGEHRSALWKSRSWPLMLDALRAALFASRAGVIMAGEAYRAAHPNSPSGPTAFELFGLDFGIDDDMRPWLYEANISPSLLGNCELLTDWVEESMESLLSTVLAFHEGKLALPKNSELDAMPGQDCLERLFPPGLPVLPGGRHTDVCYGQEVSSTQPALVAGLDLGPESPCGKWLLVVKEREKRTRMHPVPATSREMGEVGHSRILCDMLLSTTSRRGERMLDTDLRSVSPTDNSCPSPKRSSTVSKTPRHPRTTSRQGDLVDAGSGSRPYSSASPMRSSRISKTLSQSMLLGAQSGYLSMSTSRPSSTPSLKLKRSSTVFVSLSQPTVPDDESDSSDSRPNSSASPCPKFKRSSTVIETSSQPTVPDAQSDLRPNSSASPKRSSRGGKPLNQSMLLDAQSDSRPYSSASPKRSSRVSKTLSQPMLLGRTSKIAELMAHSDSRSIDLGDAAHMESESLRLPPLTTKHFPGLPHPRSRPGSSGTGTALDASPLGLERPRKSSKNPCDIGLPPELCRLDTQKSLGYASPVDRKGSRLRDKDKVMHPKDIPSSLNKTIRDIDKALASGQHTLRTASRRSVPIDLGVRAPSEQEARPPCRRRKTIELSRTASAPALMRLPQPKNTDSSHGKGKHLGTRTSPAKSERAPCPTDPSKAPAGSLQKARELLAPLIQQKLQQDLENRAKSFREKLLESTFE